MLYFLAPPPPPPLPHCAPRHLSSLLATLPPRSLSSVSTSSSDGPNAGHKREEAEEGKELVDYLGMSNEELMRQCEMGTFKASGPGGQHQNKRESAVQLKHRPGHGARAETGHQRALLVRPPQPKLLRHREDLACPLGAE
jgi:hypothetical protein